MAVIHCWELVIADKNGMWQGTPNNGKSNKMAHLSLPYECDNGSEQVEHSAPWRLGIPLTLCSHLIQQYQPLVHPLADFPDRSKEKQRSPASEFPIKHLSQPALKQKTSYKPGNVRLISHPVSPADNLIIMGQKRKVNI